MSLLVHLPPADDHGFGYPKRSPVLFPGEDDFLLPSEDAALLRMAVQLRGRRQFRRSAENTRALPAPSPTLPNPVSDALQELSLVPCCVFPSASLPAATLSREQNMQS